MQRNHIQATRKKPSSIFSSCIQSNTSTTIMTPTQSSKNYHNSSACSVIENNSYFNLISFSNCVSETIYNFNFRIWFPQSLQLSPHCSYKFYFHLPAFVQIFNQLNFFDSAVALRMSIDRNFIWLFTCFVSWIQSTYLLTPNYASEFFLSPNCILTENHFDN